METDSGDAGDPGDVGDDAGDIDAGADAGEPDGGCDADCPEPSDRYLAPPRYRAVLVPGPEGAADSYAVDINDDGELAGTFEFEIVPGQSRRSAAFRWDQTNGLVDLTADVNYAVATAINGSGAVTGYTMDGTGYRAFVHDGTLQPVGTLLDAESRANAINDRGQLAGTCIRESVEHPCRYTSGMGWLVLEQRGTANGIDAEGNFVGISSDSSLRSYRYTDFGFEEIGLADLHGVNAAAISSNGRWVGMIRTQFRYVIAADSLVLDLQSELPPREFDDADGRVRRRLPVQVKDVNDSGWSVGQSADERAFATGVLWDPRRGETYDLNTLVDVPDGFWIDDARGISNNGKIAVTLVDLATGDYVAAALLPLDSPRVAEASALSGASEAYDFVPLPSSFVRGSRAIGVDDSGYLHYEIDFWDETLRTSYLRVGRFTPFGAGNNEEYGDGSTIVPVDVSPNGRLVGTARVVEEFFESFHFELATGAGGTGALESRGRPGAAREAFGYGINSAGAAVGECLSPGVKSACLWSPDNGWTIVAQDAWAHDIADNGTVLAQDAEGVFVWYAGAATWLFLPTGATATAMSPDGRWIVGEATNGFLFDRNTGTEHALPDIYGDEPARARVMPLFVTNDGMVGGAAYGFDGVPHAFVWSLGDAELTRLTDDGPEGHHVAVARGMSATGEVAVTAYRESGLPRAGLMVPDRR